MILVDNRHGSIELAPVIQKIGYSCMTAHLEYADFAFEGNGPDGPINVGIERKTLHDMLDSIDNAHYAGRQRGGMKLLYGINFLAVEGLTKPHEPDGYLMEGFNGGASWGRCRYQHDLPYSKLFNYLVSVALTGVIITLSRDMYHTAYNVCCLYEYFRGPWDAHTSMREIQKLPLYGIGGRPSLVKRMAAQIDGIGVKLAEAAEAHFGTSDLAVERMMTATPAEWAKIKGISLQTAERIVKEIRGQG